MPLTEDEQRLAAVRLKLRLSAMTKSERALYDVIKRDKAEAAWWLAALADPPESVSAEFTAMFQDLTGG